MGIPLVVEEGNNVTLTSTLGQHFLGSSGDLQLLASLGLVVGDDLVVGLRGC